MKSKFNEALTFFKKGQLKEAKNLCLEILKGHPNNFDVLHILGIINFREKNFTESKNLIEKAIKIKPNSFEIHNFFAFVLLNLKKFDLAIKSWDEAIKLNPNYAEAYNNRGNIFFMLENLDDALKSYKQAIKLKPDFADAYNNQGNVFRKLNKNNDAIESYQKATKFEQNHADAYYNLGSIFRKQKKTTSAIKNYEKAIELKPDYVDSYVGLGNSYLELKNNSLALESYEKAIKLKPDYNFLLGTIVHTKLKLCLWDNLDRDLKDVEEKVSNLKKISPPFQLLTFNNSIKLQKISAEMWAKQEISSYKNILEPIFNKQINKKIKIGYYSADFHDHATSNLMVNLFELHDRSKFEIVGFYFGPESKHEMYIRVSNAFDQFINVKFKTDKEIAQLSRELNIDIAIDLMGFVKNNRFKIFIDRCAPIQVNYLGYPGTLGTNCFEYIIADKTLIPKECQEYYSEKIVYLPNSYQPNDSKKKISKKIFKREELDLPKNDFVFCSFNQSSKILPKTFDIWMRILKKVDRSVLWLLESNLTTCENLKYQADKRGVDSSRIIFAQRLPTEEHLARQKIADLFIDTFPCTGHTTSSDALWAGLPVLTLQGETFASRVSSSLLNAIGLSELITKNSYEYEEKAVELGNNLSKVISLKKKIETNKFTKPLFNTKLFTSHIEQAYLEMNKKYNENKKTENIEIK